ncbi:MAG: ATP-dependent DNA helicase RecG [Flavobacteriaceae bacterium]|nr:ATP-dependent DNA helicase RecG [Flavobacteriaceae bacterium]|tara:strand:- start:10281 stop:12380 length:2100 start_codon:yes stop_codon:yes gene_type:complete
MDVFERSIEFLKGIGPGRAKILDNELDIRTFRDFLFFFPYRYVDRSKFHLINDLNKSNIDVQIKGKFLDTNVIHQKKGKRLSAIFSDGNSHIELIWFKGFKWIKENIDSNSMYVIYGKINWFDNRPTIAHPEITKINNYNLKNISGIYPIYSSTEKILRYGITQKVIREAMYNLIGIIKNELTESLSNKIILELKLTSLQESFYNIHFPKNHDKLIKARFRLKFEELFFIQLQLLKKHTDNKTKIKGYEFSKVGEFFNTFYRNHLPFDLTNDQKKVIKEIRKDLGTGSQMNRLLQGDVGSGKTIVALLSMLIALDNKFQACFMAPTEILAFQHHENLKTILVDMPIQVEILTGSTKPSIRKNIHEKLLNGKINIIVGTHSLIEDKVIFKNLGIVIIDEQHRFGVAQRAKLWYKNNFPPHILVMTATPIPRTLAMSIYGDLDFSIIRELPPGRKQIKTFLMGENNRLKLFKFLREQIDLGKQIFIVYPLIEESQKMDYKDLMDGYESVCREFPLPKYRISIMHGKMKTEDKDYEMKRFLQGKSQIMVSTTVIEVGVNIPNANVMVIESSERFGLSQLHQLRGRVGRGNEQSFCILMKGKKISNDAKLRLKTMVKTTDGFEIAEVDLKLRGPGDIAGTQQSGLLKLKIADLVKDQQILKLARSYAKNLIGSDPNLSYKDNKNIKSELNKITSNKKIWKLIS